MTIKPSAGNDTALTWTKSSYSSNEGPECVEVAATPSTVHVRDSKDGEAAQLAFMPGPWTDFLAYATKR
ncbi:DUF397 domain-containing protein [Streptomyces sp. NPDC048277]|uniref:DUF397 domain-containing protein n=1 Tax=Streptomyces sp. NPDC048277 TaxID=3155027 RepID=UPI003405BFC9